MKKYILAAITAIILIPVLLVLLLPLWLGMEAEKTYHEMLDRFSAQGGFRITALQYERGWLSSTAETTLRHHQIPFAFRTRHRISHGPFPLDRLLNGDWRLTPVQTRISSSFTLVGSGNKDISFFPPISAETTIHVNGNGSVHAELPAVTTRSAKDETLEWHGMSFDWEMDRTWKKIQFNARLPQIKVSSPGLGGDITISDVSLRSNTQESTSGYSFGEGNLRIGKFRINHPTGPFDLKGFSVSATAQPADDNVNTVMRYSLDEAKVAKERFGPGAMVIEARRLDVISLVKFKKEIEAINQDDSLASQKAMIAAGKTMALFAELSKKAPEFEITHLSFKTREGEISGKAKFVLDGKNRDLTNSPVKLLTALKGNLEIYIPEPLLKRMIASAIQREIEAYRQSGVLTTSEMERLDEDTLNAIVNQAFPQYLNRHELTRLLVKAEGRYKLDFSIARGQVLINGKPWHAPTRIALPE